MTTLNVSLSADLKVELAKEGIWAYAFYWQGGSQNHVELVTDGTVGPAAALDLGTSYPSGKVYLVIQSEDPHGTHHDLGTLIADEDDLNWVNAQTYDFRYDSLELTLSNLSTDVANLTSIAGFGLPMQLAVTYADGSIGTRGYNVTGDAIFTALGQIGDTPTLATYGAGPLAGQNRAAISPSEDLGVPNTAFPSSDWTAYVDSLKSAAAEKVEVAGFFTGTTDANGVYHQRGFFSYDLAWDKSESVFWLSPDDSSTVEGHIKITPEALEESIYQTIGDVGIYTRKTDAEPYHILNSTAPGPGLTMQSGDNNQWGAVLSQFFNGFAAAYFGNEANSINKLDKTPIDLDKSWNWDPTYAFGANAVGTPAYAGNAYAKVFFENSNSYGWTYSDTLMAQYLDGGPQISVANGNVDVTTIDLTIYTDSEQPGGYTKPVIDNYVPAGGTGYVKVSGDVSTAGVTLNFANAGIVLAEDTDLSLDVYTGTKHGKPQFTNVKLDAPSAPWVAWTFARTDDGYSASIEPGVENPVGNIILSNLPAGGAGVHWYRVNVGTGASQKTFNLYAEMADGPNGLAFVNASLDKYAGQIGVDALAQVALPASTDDTIEAFTVNFLHASTTGVDPAHLVRTNDPNAPMPTAPIAGNLVSGDFVAVTGQDGLQTNSVTTSNGSVVFGWTGLADVANTPSYIGGVTNKVSGLGYAAITITKAGTPVGSPILAQADVDGQWQTDTARSLGNGTYVVTMQQHTADNASSASAVDLVSHPLTLKVAVAETGLAARGTGIALDPDADTNGNWIVLEASRSALPNGATLLLYAVDGDGAFLSRDGSQSGVGFSEAVRATLGTVHADDHTLLLETRQSVYLEGGAELRVAVLSGGDGLELAPPTWLEEQPDGSLKLEVAGVTLEARTDNSLTAAADLAHPQRTLDDALVYLTHGSEVDVSVVGSTAHTNTLAFVRMDIADDGSMSVDGVAYGRTKAFREAVREAIDNDFTLEAGGDFTREATWTVDGPSGFYAPVLFAQTGRTFVIGDANQGGNEQIRLFGENVFGFEDLAESENSDFDYNDMVMTLSVAEWGTDILI